MANGFEKIYGISERNDKVVRRGKEYYLYFGRGTDNDGDYVCRKIYDHKPAADELKSDIVQFVNDNVDAKILTGYIWEGNPVYLSSENQFNYKSLYDLALQNNDVLPAKFKLGEDSDGNVVYHTFEDIDELGNFYMGAIQFISQCLNEGWTEKDSINVDELLKTIG